MAPCKSVIALFSRACARLQLLLGDMLKPGLFWILLTICAFFAFVLCALLIGRSSGNQYQQMLLAMRSRAEDLVWAFEGGARYFRHKHGELLPEILREMGRQPGIAWVALVNDRGRIIQDSNQELAGSTLYTVEELQRLAPGPQIQGRFSPDDPDIYETWKVFQPERLERRKKDRVEAARGPIYIFIALDAEPYLKNFQERMARTRQLAILISLASLCLIALLFYIYNFHISRKKLKAAEALAFKVIEAYPGGLVATDLTGRVELYNDKAKELLGFSKAAMRNADFANARAWRAVFQELGQGATILEREIQLPVRGGRELAAILTALAIPHADKYLFVLREMDEVKKLQKRLAESRRLSAVGKLAASIAHEIRNPLSSVRGYAHYLLGRLANDPMGKASAELLVEETKRINDVLTDLLSLARPAKIQAERTDLAALLEKAALVVKPDAEAARVELELVRPEPGPCGQTLVFIDKNRFLQALLNLLLNAIHFTPAKGRVRLSLRWEGGLQAHPQGAWLIQVADSGPGIPDSIMGQIFNPYFSTRENGTGLGLSISRQIVESHGAELTVSSSPGQGATFSIILPIKEE